MLQAEVWGTVADWTMTVATGLSAGAAVVIYYLDRQRAKRAQAASVVVWLHPHEHGPPMIKMLNLSDKPVFDHGWIITPKPNEQIAKLDPKGAYVGPFKWPDNNEMSDTSDSNGGTFINYHDGSEVHLAKDQLAEYQPELKYHPGLYRYYVRFRDASGKYWFIDGDTQQLLGGKHTRNLMRKWDIGQRR